MKKINRLIFSLHGWFGLITGIFLLLLGISGSILVFKEELEELIYGNLTNVVHQNAPLPLDILYKIVTSKYTNQSERPKSDVCGWKCSKI